MASFEAVFGTAPSAFGDAPGRVNLLGEHTDYNDGYVLPIAVPRRTQVAVRRSHGAIFTVHAAQFGRTVTFGLDRPTEDVFARYVFGCLAEIVAAGLEVPPLDMHISSTVPIGVGLASSAALEVATVRAVRALLQLPLDEVMIAQLAHRAEVQHAGVHCGIMDQMAASLAGTTEALFLDTRTLERRRVPLPHGSGILVLDSGVPRALADSAFNRRRAECEHAARELGVGALRDVEPGDIAKIQGLADPWRRRARHVITENARVMQALDAHDPAEFGALMNASHTSLKTDFEVSVPALDALVELLQSDHEVYGARLTGAGFGGACVALCQSSALERIAARVLKTYALAGFAGRALVP